VATTFEQRMHGGSCAQPAEVRLVGDEIHLTLLVRAGYAQRTQLVFM
jgi:hypothetical protein